MALSPAAIAGIVVGVVVGAVVVALVVWLSMYTADPVNWMRVSSVRGVNGGTPAYFEGDVVGVYERLAATDPVSVKLGASMRLDPDTTYTLALTNTDQSVYVVYGRENTYGWWNAYLIRNDRILLRAYDTTKPFDIKANKDVVWINTVVDDLSERSMDSHNEPFKLNWTV